MKRWVWRMLRVAACTFGVWLVARLVFLFMPTQDVVAAMLLLLAVLAMATLADRVLAVATSLTAGLCFSYYFIYPSNSFTIQSTEDAVSFATFLIAAISGSHLSIRAELRAEESERRRREMAQLQELGSVLVATDTVGEAAGRTSEEITSLFGCGTILRLDGVGRVFRAGVVPERASDEAAIPNVVHQVNADTSLELYGVLPSIEVQNALVHLISLVLDKALAAEERARMVASQKGDELRTTVLNALAHNFMTPLTSIKAAASMMRGSETEPATYIRELVEIIDEEADRLDELIRDSLDLARLQARQENPRSENCSVASLIDGVTRKMKRHLAGRVTIIEIPDDLPSVRGDHFLFEQMLSQLVDNAWKYSVSGAKIWICARHLVDTVELTVRNQGIQIPDGERSLVFNRFYRGDRSRASIEGTGLGLAIARTIAEAHQGKIWLDGDPEGPAFRVTLPVGALEENHDREPHYITD